MATHTVLNHPPPLEDLNLYTADPVLAEFVEREGGSLHDQLLRGYGRNIGSSRAYKWGRDANRYPPELHTHDRFGNRIDQVEFHPAWHALMELSISHRGHSLPRASAEGGVVAPAAAAALEAGGGGGARG